MESKVGHLSDVIEVWLINRLVVHSHIDLAVSTRTLHLERHWVWLMAFSKSVMIEHVKTTLHVHTTIVYL